jgi:NADPH:quinone reductase-like Zn-dependent oxidoreductase
MKAFALSAAGTPAGLIELPQPELEADCVRVRVRAASVNGFDVFEAQGYLVSMMEHSFPVVIGRDFAGVVEAVGPAQTEVRVGDEVLGFIPSATPLHDGTYAERVSGGPGLVLARKPAGLSFEAAAAIGLAGATALDSVDAVEPRAGDTVVVVGATGGVGSFAVQLAAQRGATVIATAKSGDEADLVRGLGAAETIDYSTRDVVATIRARYPGGVDALIDFVNRGDAFAPMAALVRDGGRVATTMGAADIAGLAGRNVTATNIMGTPTTEKLAGLAAQAAAGKLQVPIQRTFQLAEAAAALAAFAAGPRGKLVIVM